MCKRSGSEQVSSQLRCVITLATVCAVVLQSPILSAGDCFDKGLVSKTNLGCSCRVSAGGCVPATDKVQHWVCAESPDGRTVCNETKGEVAREYYCSADISWYLVLGCSAGLTASMLACVLAVGAAPASGGVSLAAAVVACGGHASMVGACTQICWYIQECITSEDQYTSIAGARYSSLAGKKCKTKGNGGGGVSTGG